MDRIEAFLHYGFSPEVYDAVRPNIVDHNLGSARSLSKIFSIVMALFLVLAFAGVNRRFIGTYAVEALVFALATLVIGIPSIAERHSKAIVVVVSVALVSFGIVASVSDHTVVATSFHVVIIVVAIFFITTMPWMVGILGLGVVGLVGSSMVGKPAALAGGDAYNAVIFFLVAMALHYITSRDRIQSYVNLQELQRTRHELAIRSHFDGLSGLFNRTHFFEVTDQLDMTEPYTVCLIDIDNFKKVNDQLGHHTGDLVIEGLGEVIRATLGLPGKSGEDAASETPAPGRKTFAGRLGGDEFIMLVGPDGPDPREAGRKVQETMAAGTFGDLHGVGISIGYADTREYPGMDVGKLYRAADVKMYLEKNEHHQATGTK